MRSLELFLLHPLPERAARARLNALQRLLSKARKTAEEHVQVEGALMQRFDVTRQRDWPVAPLARLGDGETVDDGFWICADPVHLQVDRDALILVEATRYELRQPEARALLETLNQHFDRAALHFSAPTPQRWYARLAQSPAIETVPVHEAAGRNVDALLPRGEQALFWHRIFNEIQMLLHEHPVNQAREERGLPAINSVWFWGAGILPAHANGNWSHIWTSDPLSRGLALLAKIDSDDVPGDLAQWLVLARDGSHLVVLKDADAERIEEGWLGPALQALRARSLGALSLSASIDSAVARFDLTRSDLWKFWRRASA